MYEQTGGLHIRHDVQVFRVLGSAEYVQSGMIRAKNMGVPLCAVI